jgi:hypothetical protein
MRKRLVAFSLAALSTVAVSPALAGSPPREHHLMFRSKATGLPANAAQTARCDAHFADRPSVQTGSRLDYRVWGIEVDPATGLVTNDTAEDLGPGFLCSVAPASPDAGLAFQSYGYMTLGTLPEIEFEGPCRSVPTVDEGELFFNCKLAVLPDATKGIYGGFLSTNSVLNQGTPGWPTGSIWTGYVVEVAP